MKREDLSKLGITDEAVIDAIMKQHGQDIEGLRTTGEAAKAEADALKNQLAEAGKTIEGFKAMKPEELKAAADDWKTKFEQAQTEAANQLKKVQFDHALEAELKTSYKVKDPTDVMPHLKMDKLQIGDDGKIIGLKEQIEPLKTAKDYLFVPDQEVPRVVSGTQSKSVLQKVDENDPATKAAYAAAGIPLPEANK